MIVEHGDINRIKFDEARNTSSLLIGLQRGPTIQTSLIVSLHRCRGGIGKGDVTYFWTITLIAACLLASILAEQLGAWCRLPPHPVKYNAPEVFHWGFFFGRASAWTDNLNQSVSVCMIHRPHRGVMECEPLSGNAGVSFLYQMENSASLTFRSFPQSEVKFSPCKFISCPKAKIREDEVVVGFKGGIVSDLLVFGIRRLRPIKTICTWSCCISLATVALASQVGLWLLSAHAQ